MIAPRTLGLLVLIMFFAWAVYGHAIVLSATPSREQAVPGPDVPVNLRFNSRIDPKRSRLTLVTRAGEQRSLEIKDSATGDQLVSEARGLKSGSYILRWQVLASDGHITRGQVPFSVK